MPGSGLGACWVLSARGITPGSAAKHPKVGVFTNLRSSQAQRSAPSPRPHGRAAVGPGSSGSGRGRSTAMFWSPGWLNGSAGVAGSD